MGQAMVIKGLWVGYSMSCDQSPVLELSTALIQILESISWNTRTRIAAANPTPAKILTTPTLASSSSTSSTVSVAALDALGKEVPSGWVGAWSWTVAFGSV